MPNYTDNVGLRLITRPDEDNENFNTQTMLNDNWDKIDDAIGDLPGALQEMGLSQYGSVADAVNKLADFGNWWYWKRWPYVAANNTVITKPPYTDTADSFMTHSVFTVAGSSIASRYAVFEYGTSAKIRSDGTFYIENPQEITIRGNSATTGNTMVAAFNSLVGNYIRMKSFDGSNLTFWSIIGTEENKIWRIPADCEFTYLGSKSYNGGYAYIVGNTVGIRELTARSAEANSKDGVMDCVSNPIEDKYPDNGKQDSYWYEKIGRVLPTARLEMVDYVGTGVAGTESAPLTWTFSNPPKLIIIDSVHIYTASRVTTDWKQFSNLFTSSGSVVQLKKSADGKTIYRYASTGGATGGANTQGQKYSILAFS